MAHPFLQVRSSWGARRTRDKVLERHGLADWQVGEMHVHARATRSVQNFMEGLANLLCLHLIVERAVNAATDFGGRRQGNAYYCAGRVLVPTLMETYGATQWMFNEGLFVKVCLHYPTVQLPQFLISQGVTPMRSKHHSILPVYSVKTARNR